MLHAGEGRGAGAARRARRARRARALLFFCRGQLKPELKTSSKPLFYGESLLDSVQRHPVPVDGLSARLHLA